jgi:hypothetical protein
MDDKRDPREKGQQGCDTGREKRLYQKPAFRYERVFETQALSCGKIVSVIHTCQISRKTS